MAQTLVRHQESDDDQDSGDQHGVLAVQPEDEDDGLLSDRGQFVEMVANLIGKSVQLAREVAQERHALILDRFDRLLNLGR